MNVKKKLIWQIFPSFLVIILLSLTTFTLYSTRYFKKIFLDNSEAELIIRTKIFQDKFIETLKSTPDQMGRIDEQCKKIGRDTHTRVTVILPSGLVVGDSFGDIRTMENHMKRPEIRQALKRKKARPGLPVET